MNGFLNLYKPKGISSAQILNKIKKCLCGENIGHMGTLDPLASGVLPVAIGKSTRMFDFLLDKDKVYVATVAFGFETDSLDLEGKTIYQSDIIPDFNDVVVASKKLCGDIMQVPPSFSAKCVDGKRSYQLARKGNYVELPPKKVHISDIIVEENISNNEYKIKINCKGGTYIRSIARDLGILCNSRATMTSLVRESSGIFSVNNSITAEEFIDSNDRDSLLISPEDVVDYPKIFLDKTQTQRLFNGLYDIYELPNGIYRIFAHDGFYGIGEIIDRKIKIKAHIYDKHNYF